MPDKIYIHRDRKGRKGKTVTVVTIWSSDPRSDLKELQKLCGAGGTHKQNTLEIQGDHVDKIKSYLEAKDLTVRISGG